MNYESMPRPPSKAASEIRSWANGIRRVIPCPGEMEYETRNKQGVVRISKIGNYHDADTHQRPILGHAVVFADRLAAISNGDPIRTQEVNGFVDLHNRMEPMSGLWKRRRLALGQVIRWYQAHPIASAAEKWGRES